MAFSGPRIGALAAKAFDGMESSHGVEMGLSPEARERLLRSPEAAGKAARCAPSSPEKAAAKIYAKAVLAVSDLNRLCEADTPKAAGEAAAGSAPAAVVLPSVPVFPAFPVGAAASSAPIIPTVAAQGLAIAIPAEAAPPIDVSPEGMFFFDVLLPAVARSLEWLVSHSRMFLYQLGVLRITRLLSRRLVDFALTFGSIGGFLLFVYACTHPELVVKVFFAVLRAAPSYADWAFERIIGQVQYELGLVDVQPRALPVPSLVQTPTQPVGSCLSVTSGMLGGGFVLALQSLRNLVNGLAH